MVRASLIALGMLIAMQVQAQSKESIEMASTQLGGERITVVVHLPPDYRKDVQYPVLYINDGQDMPAVHLEAHLRDYYAKAEAQRMIVVAVPMFKDRMGVYGLADRASASSQVAPTKYGDVGAKSYEYNEWFTRDLIPAIDAKYPTQASKDGRTVLGWSLGAVSAFSLGWQYPELIGRIGMFSPSLWLSKQREPVEQALQTRLVQNRVANDATVPRASAVYLAIGTAEDTDDRDGDGLNDAVDDVFDLANGWQNNVGLRQRDVPTETVLLVGGKHNQAAWSAMLPRFLRWAGAK